MSEPQVHNNPTDSRFELLVDGQLAGRIDYTSAGDVLTMTHTEVDNAYAGQGFAGVLVSQALDQMRRDGFSLLPECPYVRRYVTKHREYVVLVPEHRQADFHLA